jgi:hypothetical protein
MNSPSLPTKRLRPVHSAGAITLDGRSTLATGATVTAERARIRGSLWDKFIDALDLAGQEGRIADVEVPALAIDLPQGRRFGELTRHDVETLSTQAAKVGRRTEIIMALWEDMQRKKKPARNRGLQKPTGD